MRKRSIGAKENYLRIIYKFDDGNGVKSIEIARELNISKPSVSEMLRKLASHGLIKIKPYSKIFLTTKGRIKAEKLFDKHYTIKRFMKHVLKHDDEKANEESHKISHLLSEETINTIEKLMEEKFEEAEKILKPLPSYIG